MKTITALLAIALSAPPPLVFALSGELNSEQSVTNAIEPAKDLPQTLVMRTDSQGSVSVFHAKERLAPDARTRGDVERLNFKTVEPNVAYVSELNRDSSRESWFFIFGLFALFAIASHHNNHYNNNNYAPPPPPPAIVYNNFYYGGGNGSGFGPGYQSGNPPNQSGGSGYQSGTSSQGGPSGYSSGAQTTAPYYYQAGRYVGYQPYYAWNNSGYNYSYWR